MNTQQWQSNTIQIKQIQRSSYKCSGKTQIMRLIKNPIQELSPINAKTQKVKRNAMSETQRSYQLLLKQFPQENEPEMQNLYIETPNQRALEKIQPLKASTVRENDQLIMKYTQKNNKHEKQKSPLKKLSEPPEQNKFAKSPEKYKNQAQVVYSPLKLAKAGESPKKKESKTEYKTKQIENEETNTTLSQPIERNSVESKPAEQKPAEQSPVKKECDINDSNVIKQESAEQIIDIQFENYETQQGEFKALIINSRNTQITAVMYLKENGDIEGPKSTYMATYLIEQRIEYAFTAIQNCRILQQQYNNITKQQIMYQKSLNRLQQSNINSIQNKQHTLQVLLQVQNYFKTQRMRYQQICCYNSLIKGDNSFQSAICQILKLKQVKRYEGEYLFKINSKLEFSGPAQRQTAETKFIYDKRVFVHKCVEYLFTYDAHECLKCDFLSCQYCTFQGILKEKEARDFCLYLSDSISSVQESYSKFYCNLDFIRDSLKNGVFIETQTFFPPLFSQLFENLAPLFFGPQFPLLQQFTELKNLIQQVNGVFSTEILQENLNEEPKTVNELFEQLFKNYQKFTEFCEEILGINNELFDAQKMIQTDTKQKQLEHVQNQIQKLQQREKEIEDQILSHEINIEDMIEKIMMSCDYLEAEIQNGGCQASLMCNGLEPDRDW
ncbi:Conserved_hypothetical protein [Hexamita inflata]|uniref:Uncharacterized protein n=1 Tax=Hexamita inflata TaxID=28002 RepID=A0AA86RPR2_9EUKA|nr:Conserved hypothetical protein [Hexamita inflata]